MFKRKIVSEFEKWKNSDGKKKALVVKGLRQIGKTYSVCEFAKANYKNIIYVEADGGHVPCGIGRKCGIDVGVLVHLHVFQAQACQFVFQVLSQLELLLRTRAFALILLARLGVYRHIFEKSLNKFCHNVPRICCLLR